MRLGLGLHLHRVRWGSRLLIAQQLAMEGAKNRRGHICARGLVGLAATGATVFHQELMEIMRPALATSTSKPITKLASVHKYCLFFAPIWSIN